MKRLIPTACAALALACLHVANAQASVVVGGTRVVFSAKQGETTLRLTNKGTRAALVEAWIDRGNPNSTPDSVTTPFLITPPLFRMEPNKDQSLRILFVQGSKPLPTDRESLFWLNVLEIPPKPTGPAADKNSLQFAIRSRLKLFYRPAGLAGSAIKAPDQLTFKVGADGASPTLDVHNPTPYYITISKVAFGAASKPLADVNGMVVPFGDLKLPVKGLAHPPASGTPIMFTTINDYGAGDIHKSTVAQ